MRKDIHRMPDVPWHVGYVKMSEDDTRRDKRRCVHYQKGNLCPYHSHCIGSSHCHDYKEAEDYNPLHELQAQTQPIASEPRNPAMTISNDRRAQRGDKIFVRDLETRERFSVPIWKEAQLSGIAQNAIGCTEGDTVKYGEYSYKILFITDLE